LVLFVLAAFLFFLGLGSLPLLEPDEGRNAEVAREMLASGDWITPHFNSLPYLDKPAFFFWLLSVSLRLWGTSEWAARFPSALLALLTTLLAWVLARRMFGQVAGLRAGVVFATTPLVIALARLVALDMALTWLITVSMLSFWYAEISRRRPARLDALAFAAMGLASITKGPVGFLIPILSLAAYHALRRRLGDLKRIHWGLGLGVLLAVTLPWFVAVSIRHPDFPRYALWQESLERFATGHARRTGSVLYYIPVYLAGLFPWSLFLLFAGWNRVKQWRELSQEVHRPVVFLLAWAGAVFVFFSVSQSKLPSYFLPAAVPLSILMARVWPSVDSQAQGSLPGWVKAGFASLIPTGLVVAAASQLFRWEVVRARAAIKLPPSLIVSFQSSTLYTGFILMAWAIIGRHLTARVRAPAPEAIAFVWLAVTVPLLAARWIAPLKAYANHASSRQLARTILASPEKDLLLYGYYYFRTSLPFYLRRPVGLVTSAAGELTSNYISSRWSKLGADRSSRTSARERIGRFPATFTIPMPLLTDAVGLQELARFPGMRLLIIARNSHVGALAQTVGEIEPLWNGWEYSVWKNGRR
jgi:4-amino-4-deoxy-L-arabinose transferase-like glycosyltransferase